MKNIAIFCGSMSFGGLEMNILKYACHLKSRGNNVLFIASRGSKISEKIGSYYLENIHIKKPCKYYDFYKAIKMAVYLGKIGYNNIIVTDPRDLNFISLVKTFYGSTLNVLYIQQMQIGVNKKDILHTYTFSKINYWISPLESLANQVSERTKYNKNKIIVSPLSIDITHFSQYSISKESARQVFHINNNKYLVGIIGRIDKLKGQDTVIKSINILSNQYNMNIELLICGEKTKNESDDYYNYLLSLINNFKLTNKIHFSGHIDDTRMFYKAVDVSIMASESETFGCVTIEALTSGTPVIGTNTGGTNELLGFGEFGLTFTPGDYLKLADLIKSYYDNKSEVSKRSLLAKNIAIEKYSYDKMCSIIETKLI